MLELNLTFIRVSPRRIFQIFRLKVNRNRFSFRENFLKGVLISHGINLVFKVDSEGFLSSRVACARRSDKCCPTVDNIKMF